MSVTLPEQSNMFETSQGFILQIDSCQNAIKSIYHPSLNWHKYEKQILKEARAKYPGIEIWRKWTVTYASSQGENSTINVAACRSDLKNLFSNIVKVEEEVEA